jgi:hypothetical protein
MAARTCRSGSGRRPSWGTLLGRAGPRHRSARRRMHAAASACLQSTAVCAPCASTAQLQAECPSNVLHAGHFDVRRHMSVSARQRDHSTAKVLKLQLAQAGETMHSARMTPEAPPIAQRRLTGTDQCSSTAGSARCLAQPNNFFVPDWVTTRMASRRSGAHLFVRRMALTGDGGRSRTE